MNLVRVVPFICIFLAGCIDPLPVEYASGESALVVDGMITDEAGSYTVKLFRTIPLLGDTLPERVTGASVWIVDDEENTYDLEETAPGTYKTDPAHLRGEIGKSYTLRFITRDGKEYASGDEPLLPAGEIEDLSFLYKKNAINQTDPTLPQDVVQFLLGGTPHPDNAQGYTRWRSTGVYEVLTFPELRTKIVDGEEVPDPLPCSGYVNDNNLLVQVDTCSCCTCWKYEYSRTAVVSPALHGAGGFKDVPLAAQPAESWRFFRRYYLEVEQLSLSEDVYEFWKRISAQKEGTGSLFQPNAVKVVGNIRCLSDPEEEVFGVFAASAVVRRAMFLTRGDLPEAVTAPPQVPFDCRYVVPGATNVKPSFW